MIDSADLTPVVNLDDPKTLLHECENAAQAMKGQADAASGRSPYTGHPDPSAFYASVARVLTACAKRLKDALPPEPAAEPKRDESKTEDAPSPQAARKGGK